MKVRLLDLAIGAGALLLVVAAVWAVALRPQGGDSGAAQAGQRIETPATATATAPPPPTPSPVEQTAPGDVAPPGGEGPPSVSEPVPSLPEAPPPPPPPPPPPIDTRPTPLREELHFEFLYYEVYGDGLAYYVYFENYNREWSVCNLAFWVRVQDFNGVYHDGQQASVGTIAPRAHSDPVASFVPGAADVVYAEMMMDWTWC